MDIQNLEQKLKHQQLNNRLKIISRLKFQNQIYEKGENIRIRSGINSSIDLYGKILIIIQASQITKFPLINVAWYQTIQSEHLTSSLDEQIFSAKQLILTQSKDWQYIQAVKGKIQVITETQYLLLDPKQQQNIGLFYCRSYLNRYKQLYIDAKKHCFCLKYYTPGNPLVMCQICNVLFHPNCSGRQDRCIKCHY